MIEGVLSRGRPRTRLSRLVLAASALALVVAFVPGSRATADATGNLLYTPTSANESNAYARMIELQHAGTENGTLLATFEHWYNDGSAAQYIIKSSSDGGADWSTLSNVPDSQTGPGHPVSQMWQPFLFEFPQQLGTYPAGTIMLLGNTAPANVPYTEFQEWLSSDHGKSWKPMGVVQNGGTFGAGIWEPSVHLDTRGELVMEFSDERDDSAHSQMVSGDGGASWSAPVPVVASAVQPDRPGMANVVREGPHGGYVMSFELCGQAQCAAHIKTSSDGLHWGKATDLGSALQTPEGYYLGHSPNITWVPNGTAQGELVAAGQQVYNAVDSTPASIDYRAVFVNTDGGQGPWYWSPSPWTVSSASSACNADYSPDLLPVGSDGMIRYTAPTSVPGLSPCGEATGVSDIGVLPYHSAFNNGDQSGWDAFGGNWSIADGALTETAGGVNGNKALAGSSGWTDYQVSAQLEATSTSGDQGVAVRVSDPSVGADSYHGYLVFFDTKAGTFVIAREDYSYEPLAIVPIPGGTAPDTWYQMTIKVVGNQISATLANAGGTQVAQVSATDPASSFPQGMIALRDFAGTASFRDVAVTQLP